MRGWASRLTSASDWPVSSASIIRPTFARAASKRDGVTSVACMDALASSRTMVYGPVDCVLNTNGRATAPTIAASAAICSRSSSDGGTRRQGRCASRSCSAANHRKVLDTRLIGRRGRSK